MAVRETGGRIVKDNRKFYSFVTYGGRLAETKAVTKDEAKAHIERSLQTKIRRAA